MRKIHDKKRIQERIKDSGIDRIIEVDRLTAWLAEFDDAEIINQKYDPTDYLIFVTSGTIEIYYIRDDGARYTMRRNPGFCLLGDVEFCGRSGPPSVIRAVGSVETVVVPVREGKERLLEDARFLRFLLSSITEKFMGIWDIEIQRFSIEEKVWHYFQNECRNGVMRDIEKMLSICIAASGRFTACSARWQRLGRSLGMVGENTLMCLVE